ncbi:winged helix-turn-helix domain-containing protein [Microbispora triticiradicis]|uniref:winged helix-turn-helix domain-containing protein n=1 Tax=Microbispora triticiradicis TaxID=2200763 RepID=UPI001AD6B5A5|nr:winged helix-turn-helix domain-containing protein [Microbispora triticiradicis]MBO4275463.1 hypothetical protein [Microbispora triticiradicis]
MAEDAEAVVAYATVHRERTYAQARARVTSRTEGKEELSQALNGEGLLLAPSVFVWPHLLYRTNSPGQAAITYPVRVIATLWERGTAPVPGALAAVIGRSRALLLSELDAPASTTDLAGRTGLAPASVSEQLTLLLSAGPVTKHRVGRAVLYVRTPRGHALLDG